MGLWNWFFGGGTKPATTNINPATGLPMVGDVGGLDVAGNPYGVDLSVDSFDSFGVFGSFDSFDSFDSFIGSGSSFGMGSDSGAGFSNDWSD